MPTERRASLADTIFEKLKDGIISGEYAAEKLLPTQEDLAAKFGVSRTVMRDAFNKLSSLGLVEIRQGKGSIVRSADPMAIVSSLMNLVEADSSMIQDLMEARYYIEQNVIRLAAARATPEDLKTLAENLLHMEEAVLGGNSPLFAELDLEFHQRLAEISRNKILKRMLDAVRGVMKSFFDAFSRTPGVAPRAIEYHRRIHRALAEKDAEEAERALKDHLRDIIVNLKLNYDIDVLL